jgi:hypothetical protein
MLDAETKTCSPLAMHPKLSLCVMTYLAVSKRAEL